MTDQLEESLARAPDENIGWHEPVGATSYPPRQNWYIPPDAATQEQLDALQASLNLDLIHRPDDLPGGFPAQAGAWYSPQGADVSFKILPASELGELAAPSFDTAFSPIEPAESLEVAAPIALDELITEIEPAPEAEGAAVPLDEAELAFRSAPRVLGEVTSGFADAPEVPLSASLQAGLGGLRDQEAAIVEDTPSLTPGLSLEDAALQQQSAAPEVPARGFGGLQDAPGDGQPTGPDTGPIQTGIPGQPTPALLATPSLSATPTIQEMTQPYPQNQLAQSQPPMSSQPTPPSAQRFIEVEQSVQALRQRFSQGQITRAQLEAELRRLMVLDEQGRWWTLGVDSSRWYRYDGREWIPDIPPQSGPSPAILNVPTETGVQPPTSISNLASASIPPGGDISALPGGIPRVALDEYGMPLPARVPQEDPGATMVNLSAFNARADEPTIEGPGPAPGSLGMEAATLRPGTSEAQLSPAQAAQVVVAQPGVGPYEVTADGELVGEKNVPGVDEKQRRNTVQGPDYSEALGGSMSRSGATKLAIWGSIIGVVSVLGITLCVLLAMVGYYFSVVNDYGDAIDTLSERASTFQTSTILAGDNETVLMQINDPNRGFRQKVALEDISPWAIHALISTEDETYYENPGFSVYAILRATYTNLRGSGVESGASTITQQLARRLLLNEDFAAQVSARRKVTEIILAAELSRQYDKNEIIELYFNEISFGGYTVGIEAAAQTYFGKSASDLNIAESALLVGLVQSPAVYDPFQNRDLAIGRMKTVLRLMTEANGTGCVQMTHTFSGTGFDLSQPLCITQSALENEFPADIAFVEIRQFEPPINELRYAHFAFWVREELFSRFSQDFIYNTGLRVITTLNPTLQEVAQRAVVDQVAFAPSLGVTLNNGSVVAIDPTTGAILAMVGSADYGNKVIKGEVNVALTPQQPGSSIKPIVYLAAFEGADSGVYYTPATVLWDTPSDWSGYQPVNFDGDFHGPMSIRVALSNSYNIPAVKTLQFVTPQRFEEVANRTGITFPLQSPVQVGLPAALGAAEITLLEQVAAFAAFANNGVYSEPYGIQRIETLDGEIIFDAAVDIDPNLVSRQTMDPTHAFLINSILSDVQARRQEFPTDFTRLELPGGYTPAVKTGSTNDNRDSLTVGWTPQIIVGVWMGNTDNSPTGERSGGWYMAAPVWNKVMQQALQGLPVVSFTPPPGVIQQTVCADSGTVVPQNDPTLCGPGGTSTEYFVSTQPPPPAERSIINVIEVDAFTGLRANQFCPNYITQRVFLNTDDPTVVPWLQTTAQGQTWAASRGIDPESLGGTIPTDECRADQPVPLAVLNSPFNGMVLNRLVTFTGQATAPDFDHYEIQYASIAAPDQYIIIPGQAQQFDQPNPGSTLGTWDSTALANGQYYIRLAVFGRLPGAVAFSTPAQVTITNTTTSTEAVPGTETVITPVPPAQ